MRVTLELVEALEKEGALFAAAETLLQREESAALRPLAKLLIEILTPIMAMGAVYEQDGQRHIDFQKIRYFFLGVRGWTPRSLYQEASLQDLAAAFEGYAAQYPTPDVPISAEFLKEMIKNYPDQKGESK